MIGMTQERYGQLMLNDDLPLTEEEIKLGWHFCWEWDGLLIGPGTEEFEYFFCKCRPEELQKSFVARPYPVDPTLIF